MERFFVLERQVLQQLVLTIFSKNRAKCDKEKQQQPPQKCIKVKLLSISHFVRARGVVDKDALSQYQKLAIVGSNPI